MTATTRPVHQPRQPGDDNKVITHGTCKQRFTQPRQLTRPNMQTLNDYVYNHSIAEACTHYNLSVDKVESILFGTPIRHKQRDSKPATYHKVKPMSTSYIADLHTLMNTTEFATTLKHLYTYANKQLRYRNTHSLQGMTGQDFVHDVIVKVLTGVRHYNSKTCPSFERFLYGCVKSELSHHMEHTTNAGYDIVTVKDTDTDYSIDPSTWAMSSIMKAG